MSGLFGSYDIDRRGKERMSGQGNLRVGRRVVASERRSYADTHRLTSGQLRHAASFAQPPNERNHVGLHSPTRAALPSDESQADDQPLKVDRNQPLPPLASQGGPGPGGVSYRADQRRAPGALGQTSAYGPGG